MPHRTVYVISDLHLGGSTDFQMCPPENRARLANFIRNLGVQESRQGRAQDVELVIAGDFVDFLAEETIDDDGVSRFSAFTKDLEHARTKFRQLLKHVDGDRDKEVQVFAAIRCFCARGHRLSVLLGNHDLELSLPLVREELVRALSDDKPARLQFLYDGEILSIGDLRIDHGNRADGWNQIFHDDLRRFRSAATRGELDPRADFKPPPGSMLVVDIMNDLKKSLPFVDLLKPETEAVLPILVALRPSVFDKLPSIFRHAATARLREQAPGEPPRHRAAIASDEAGVIDLGYYLKKIARAPTVRRPEALRKALLHFSGAIGQVDDILHEHPRYEEAARTLADDQPQVVVFGHTHLARDIPLNPVGGRYINSGTWCDLIRLPRHFSQKSTDAEAEAHIVAEIAAFLEDLSDKTRWRRRVESHTTTVRVVVETADDRPSRILDAQLLEVHPNGDVSKFTGYRTL